MYPITGAEDSNKDLQDLCEVPEAEGCGLTCGASDWILAAWIWPHTELFTLLQVAPLAEVNRNEEKPGSKSMFSFSCVLDNCVCVCVCVYIHTALNYPVYLYFGH